VPIAARRELHSVVTLILCENRQSLIIPRKDRLVREYMLS
jgi:hypothetical protein